MLSKHQHDERAPPSRCSLSLRYAASNLTRISEKKVDDLFLYSLFTFLLIFMMHDGPIKLLAPKYGAT